MPFIFHNFFWLFTIQNIIGIFVAKEDPMFVVALSFSENKLLVTLINFLFLIGSLVSNHQPHHSLMSGKFWWGLKLTIFETFFYL